MRFNFHFRVSEVGLTDGPSPSWFLSNNITFLIVIAIDNNAKRLNMARHNARIYGIEDRIEFILGDFTKLVSRLKVVKEKKKFFLKFAPSPFFFDRLISSYRKHRVFDIETMMELDG
jgi:predicted O-methyltransferase YrrM